MLFRSEMRLENYSRLEISKHLQVIMLLTKKVFNGLFPCRMRITLNCPLDLRELALKRDPTKEEYMALGEYDQETVVSICSEMGFYGSVYPILYNKQKSEQ